MRKLIFLFLFTMAFSGSAVALPTTQEWVVVVNASSSGVEFLSEFKDLGFKVFHIWTQRKPAEHLKIVYDQFPVKPDESLVAEGMEYGELLAIVEKLNPKTLVIGSDDGVQLGNQLLRDLNMPHNGGDHIDILSQKTLQQSLLKQNGVPTISVTRNDGFQSVENWMEATNLTFPLFIRPNVSVGSNHAYRVDNKMAFEKMVAKIFAGSDYHGRKVESVVVQPLKTLRQYAPTVLAYQYQGYTIRQVVEVLIVDKSWNQIEEDVYAPVYESTRFATEDEMRSEPISNIVKRTLQLSRIFSLNSGLHHIELFEDGSLGELNARAPGDQLPQLGEKYLNRRLMHATSLAALGRLTPERLRELLPSIQTYLAQLDIVVPAGIQGTWKGLNVELVPRLEGVDFVFQSFLEGGNPFLTTTDMNTIPGQFQVHASTGDSFIQFKDGIKEHSLTGALFESTDSSTCELSFQSKRP